MTPSRDINERIERIREYHQASKLTFGAPDAPKESAPQPAIYRVFDGYPKIDLPTSLLGSTVPALSLLYAGLEAVPESQVAPPQDLRTLTTWLYLGYGRTKKPLRTCPSESNLYPCEVYVAAFGIEGLEPGLYHFSVKEFALRKLRDGWETLARLKKGRPDLEFLKTVPAVLLVSTIFCRSTWKYHRRGYRHCLTDAGQLLQNLSSAATGSGIQTLTRLRLNNQTARELIGIAQDADFAYAEAVQGMVIWADKAKNPIVKPPGPIQATADLDPLPRPSLAGKVIAYGSILAVHEDCVAPGVALREVRPPLTELSPLTKDFPNEDLPLPDKPEGGDLLGRILMTKSASINFSRGTISRDKLWNFNRLAFRWGSSFPLFPDGPHVALVRPFWIINGITGMDAGVWYYHPQKDAWSIISKGPHRIEAKFLAANDEAFGNASAVCFLFANLNRLLTECGPDLYRLSHLEAGSAAQRFYLAAVSSNLGCKFSTAFYDEDVRKFFGVEKTGWEPIYSFAVGTPPDGRPIAAEMPEDFGDQWR